MKINQNKKEKSIKIMGLLCSRNLLTHIGERRPGYIKKLFKKKLMNWLRINKKKIY